MRLLVRTAIHVICLRTALSEREPDRLEWPIQRKATPQFKWKEEGIRELSTKLAEYQQHPEDHEEEINGIRELLDRHPVAGQVLTEHQIDLLRSTDVFDLRAATYQTQTRGGKETVSYKDKFNRTLPKNTAELSEAERHRRRDLVNNVQRKDIEKQERLSYFPWLEEADYREGKDDQLKPIPLVHPEEVRATVGWSETEDHDHKFDAKSSVSDEGLRYTHLSDLADAEDQEADAYAEKIAVLEGAARRAVSKANDMNDIVKDHVHLINRANRAAVIWNNEARQEHLDTVEHFADQVHGEKWETIADQLLEGFKEFGTPEEQRFLNALLAAPP